MANRSPFLRSTCLVLLIALCFGVIGSVQAAPMRYNLTEKSLSHRVQENPFGKMPGGNTFAPVSYSRADKAIAATGWKRDHPSPGIILRENVQGVAPSIVRSPHEFNFTIPERNHVIIPAKDKVLNQSVVKSSLVSGTGTVVYMDLEGGFYGIIADDGTHYLPDTLPPSCRVDGIRVKFTGMEKTHGASIYMWGTSLRILTAVPLGEEVKSDGRIEYVDLAGGFYGIVTRDGRSYLPRNLPKEYQVDGMEVSFTARTVPDTLGIYMWGIPVTLMSISKRSDGEDSVSTPLIGTWTLAGMVQGSPVTPVIPGTKITAEFSDKGRVSGTSGCNLYSASYQAIGQSLKIGLAASTKMYCVDLPEGMMEQESIYLQLLEKAGSWKVRGGDLVISDASGCEILVFSPGTADASNEEEPLVEFWRTGGFAGMNDHLAVYPDGSVSLTRKEYFVGFTISEEELETIEALLVDSGFIGLAPHYRAPPGSADLFLYQIRAYGKTVLAEDTAIPEALQPLIEDLTRLVVENAPDDVIPPRRN
ncbi:MAG: META domain-containing protein [Methanolinea sp.]|nr:META domain-containing protein [Methanolinea sp.]